MKGTEFTSVQVGDRLPELRIDITAKLITGAAIASRDYQNVHHDQDSTRDLGSPNIFMNILTTNGFVGRYVMDWAGPSGILKKVSIRLGAPNYPGDSMVMSGEVVGKNDTDQSVELKVTGENAIGDHVKGNVVVLLR
jgi:hypothetical protein